MTSATVSVTGVQANLGAFRDLGLDATGLAREAGFEAAQLEDPEATVPAARLYALWDRAVRAWGRTGLGLTAGRIVPIGVYHVLDYLLLTASTLEEGLRDFVAYYALATRTGVYELHDEGDVTACEMVWRIPPAGVMFELRDYSLAIVARRAHEASGARPSAVEIAGPALATPAEYEAAVGAPVRLHASRNALLFAAAACRAPLPRHDAFLRQTLRRHADLLLARGATRAQATMTERVREELLKGSRVGVPPITVVARGLGVGVRTLQRQLRAEGIGFAALADDVRAGLAREYVSDAGVTIAETGYLLGFSEPSAFTRAFRRWTGCSPQAFRRRAAVGSAEARRAAFYRVK